MEKHIAPTRNQRREPPADDIEEMIELDKTVSESHIRIEEEISVEKVDEGSSETQDDPINFRSGYQPLNGVEFRATAPIITTYKNSSTAYACGCRSFGSVMLITTVMAIIIISVHFSRHPEPLDSSKLSELLESSKVFDLKSVNSLESRSTGTQDPLLEQYYRELHKEDKTNDKDKTEMYKEDATVDNDATKMNKEDIEESSAEENDFGNHSIIQQTPYKRKNIISDIIMEDLSTPEEEEEENENHTVNYNLVTRKVFDEPLDVFTEVYSKISTVSQVRTTKIAEELSTDLGTSPANVSAELAYGKEMLEDQSYLAKNYTKNQTRQSTLFPETFFDKETEELEDLKGLPAHIIDKYFETTTQTENPPCFTVDGNPCIFPVLFGGFVWNRCIPSSGGSWCPTSMTIDHQYNTWSYCDPNNCHAMHKYDTKFN